MRKQTAARPIHALLMQTRKAMKREVKKNRGNAVAVAAGLGAQGALTDRVKEAIEDSLREHVQRELLKVETLSAAETGPEARRIAAFVSSSVNQAIQGVLGNTVGVVEHLQLSDSKQELELLVEEAEAHLEEVTDVEETSKIKEEIALAKGDLKKMDAVFNV